MGDDDLRERAVKRIKDKREFLMHIVAYIVINGFLTGIWALGGRGYFWPAWVMLAWGIGLVLHGARLVLEGRLMSEKDIEREMRRLGGPDKGLS
jgi:hypothetical protein